MGYFPNGTEGDIWTSENCARCEHWNGREEKDFEKPGCMVEFIHLNWNYGQKEGSDLQKVMDCLIPRNKEECFNEKCSMFINMKNNQRLKKLEKENKELKAKMLRIGWNKP